MSAERAKGHLLLGAQRRQPALIRPPNPFATCFTRPGSLPYRALEGAALPSAELLHALADAALQHRVAAICGPHGSGKSTLLVALLPLLKTRFAGVVHSTLRSDSSTWPAAGRLIATPRRFLLVVDGWEQLPWPVAAAVLAACRIRGVQMLVTCHRVCRRLPVIWQAGTDRETARAMTESLLVACPQYRARIMNRFDHRWQESGGNVRELWFALYDDFEAMMPAAPEIAMTDDPVPRALAAMEPFQRDAACRSD